MKVDLDSKRKKRHDTWWSWVPIWLGRYGQSKQPSSTARALSYRIFFLYKKVFGLYKINLTLLLFLFYTTSNSATRFIYCHLTTFYFLSCNLIVCILPHWHSHKRFTYFVSINCLNVTEISLLESWVCEGRITCYSSATSELTYQHSNNATTTKLPSYQKT